MTNLLAAAAVAVNLIANGTFSDGLGGWFGGPYGGGPGVLESVVSNGNAHARLSKERGPGATQMMRKVPIGTNGRFTVGFRHRGDGATFGWYYVHPVDGKLQAVHDAAGGRLSGSMRLEPSATWRQFTNTVAIPVQIREANLSVMLQFSLWGENSPVMLEVDDVSLTAEGEVPPPPVPPPLNVVVDKARKEMGYGAFPIRFPFAYTNDNGLLLRDGKPFFWVGNGSDLGSSHSSAVGLWAAKLLGYSAVTLQPFGSFRIREEKGTNVMLEATATLSEYSRFREATRLGLLADYFANANYRWSPLRQLAEAHPDFKETHYDCGHYMDTDTGTSLGRTMQFAKRHAYCQYLDDAPQKPIVEFCREPGPDPTNQRIRRAFREWAKRKYGTLTEANAVWHRDFTSWDEVVPPHLEDKPMDSWMKRITMIRLAQEQSTEMYWDWLSFVQEDFTQRVAGEREDMKRTFPELPTTIDCRSHGIQTDSYCALDPELIDPLVDFMFIHFGCLAYVYNQEPYDLPTLLDQTSFPLFSYNFFRTNTRHPIINSEDIISAAMLPKSDGESMARNDLAQAHRRKWRFRLEEEGADGLAAGWEKKDFDDSQWDEMTVPGCWDETERYNCKPGVAWYRLRFRCDEPRLNYEDGSHSYWLYGKGVAQAGRIWLNGEYVGEVKGWDTPYKFDIGDKLVFGGENELVFRVDGNGFQNGLRFYCHVLANDKIGKSVPFGARQYRLMLWPYLMQGTSGVMVWSWHKDYMRPYMPDLLKRLETAAEVVLPDLRFRRHKVAYLFGFLGARGLPCTITGSHTDYLNWLDAMEFSGVRPDIFGERRFRAEVTPETHPLLVVPFARFVDDETYAHFKRYVEEGGTAVVTDGSLEKTFSRWRDTDIREFAAIDGTSRIKTTRRGKGSVVYISGKPDMEELMALLKPVLPPAEITVASSEKGELPLIERVFAGTEDRKVLYLGNWGGLDHPLEVRIPEGFGDWRMTPLEGGFTRLDGQTFQVKVPSQDVAALLLEAPSMTARAVTEVPAAQRQALERIDDLMNPAKGDPTRPTVLWPTFHQSHGVTPVGMELYPYLLDRFDAFGLRSVQKRIDQWTLESLRRHRVVVLPETNTQQFYRKNDWTPFADMIRAYVEEGGSVLLLVNTAYCANCYGNLLAWNGFSAKFGLSKGAEARSLRHSAFGDTRQMWTDNIPETALSEGVRSILTFCHTPLSFSKNSVAWPVVKVPEDAEIGAGKATMAALEIGKGRMFFSSDAMAFQPFRIGEADNAALLENIVGWLLRTPVTQEMRDEFKANLFVDDALQGTGRR